MTQTATSQCLRWFVPVCPPKQSLTNLLRVNFRHRKVTWSASAQLFSRWRISSVLCSFHVSAVRRLDPAALLDYQLSVFLFIFVLHEPTVKRATAHTDAVLYVSRVFKLFIFWSIAFTELCSNSSGVIYYYDENFIVTIVVFGLFLFPCFILGRLSTSAAPHVADQRTPSVNWRVNKVRKPLAEIFEDALGYNLQLLPSPATSPLPGCKPSFSRWKRSVVIL